MSATISQAEVAEKLGGRQMTDNAAAGVSLPAESVLTGAGIDRELVASLALKHATTPKGGMKFKPKVLADKVRAEVRSRLGLDAKALVPAEVNAVICDVCARIVDIFNADLAKRGFSVERASAERSRVRGRDDEMRLDRIITVTHAKALTWKDQREQAKLDLGDMSKVGNESHPPLYGMAMVIHKLDKGQRPDGSRDTLTEEKRAERRARLIAQAERLQQVIANAKEAIRQAIG